MKSTAISLGKAQIFHKYKSTVCASFAHPVLTSPYFLMEMKPRVSVASI